MQRKTAPKSRDLSEESKRTEVATSKVDAAFAVQLARRTIFFDKIADRNSGCATLRSDPSSASMQLIARAHDHGMRIIGATLTPFAVAFKGTPLEGYYNADKEASEWQSTNGFAIAAHSTA